LRYIVYKGRGDDEEARRSAKSAGINILASGVAIGVGAALAKFVPTGAGAAASKSGDLVDDVASVAVKVATEGVDDLTLMAAGAGIGVGAGVAAGAADVADDAGRAVVREVIELVGKKLGETAAKSSVQKCAAQAVGQLLYALDNEDVIGIEFASSELFHEFLEHVVVLLSERGSVSEKRKKRILTVIVKQGLIKDWINASCYCKDGKEPPIVLAIIVS
jgi:hypothetical protein